MPLILAPLTENDLRAFTHICNAAFSRGMASKLIPKPLTSEKFAEQVDKHRKSFLNDKDVTYLKIVDTDLEPSEETGQMIAGGKWRINLKERTAEEMEATLPKPPVVDHLDGESEDARGRRLAERDFVTYLADTRREWMGTKPFFCECNSSLIASPPICEFSCKMPSLLEILASFASRALVLGSLGM